MPPYSQKHYTLQELGGGGGPGGPLNNQIGFTLLPRYEENVIYGGNLMRIFNVLASTMRFMWTQRIHIWRTLLGNHTSTIVSSVYIRTGNTITGNVCELYLCVYIPPTEMQLSIGNGVVGRS